MLLPYTSGEKNILSLKDELCYDYFLCVLISCGFFFPVLCSLVDFSPSNAMEIYQINFSITNNYFGFVRYTEILLKIDGISYSMG